MAYKGNRGQASLIALLILTIATTVGLSLIARSTTDISVTRNLEESARAFSAAEAGVESVLKTGIESSGTIDTQLGTTYNVQIASISATAANPLVFPGKTDKEETETVWLTDHNADGTIHIGTPLYTQPYIRVCWSREPTEAAILATVLYRDVETSSYRVVKAVFDPLSRLQTTSPLINTTAGCNDGATYYRAWVTFADLNATLDPAADTLIALRVRPLFTDVQLAVWPTADLPYQGFQISSEGQTPSGVTRKILVYQAYKAPASIFDAAVVSQNGQFKH